ncbi:MAG: hypothetical protein QM534_19105 [Sediminibacterium sp.]|nr:hypothetical protein [Sediminibacterium sp.]
MSVFAAVDIDSELARYRTKTRTADDVIIQEVHRILNRDLLSDKKILDNLKHYTHSFKVLNEDECDSLNVYTLSEIKKVAIDLKLRFLDSPLFKGEIPYEAVLKIADLNRTHAKDLSDFKILGTFQSFTNRRSEDQKALFVPTDGGNFYLIHTWGAPLKWHRKWLHWPLRSFENLFLTVLIITMILAAGIPTRLLSSEPEAVYWNGWRIAAFFHFLIFNMAVTAYVTFAFSKNFQESTWNTSKQF